MLFTKVFLAILGVALFLSLVGGGLRRLEGFETQKAQFVFYFAPWCKFCKELQPEWEKLETEVKKLKLDVVLAKVDADADPKIGEEKGIQGYPTIRLERPKGKAVEYDGPRTLDGMLAFLKKEL